MDLKKEKAVKNEVNRKLEAVTVAGADTLRALENMPGIIRGSGSEQGTYVRGSGWQDMAYRLALQRVGDPLADWKGLQNNGDRVEVPSKAKVASDPYALPIPLVGVSFSF